MKEKYEIFAELDRVVSELTAESVEQIDFDRMIALLHESRTLLSEHESIIKELSELKTEYRAKILGMLKANLACRESEEERDLAVRLADEDSDTKAGELITHYRRTAARFRKNFPATFRNLTYVSGMRAGHKDWRDYKV